MPFTPASFLEPRAAYVHVPFCAHRCGYCNFTLVAGRDDLIDRYIAAIECELSWMGRAREVDTLFVGGGTPTHLPPQKLDRLLARVLRWFPLAVGHEFSVEANPLDLNADRVAVLAAHGVTRISLGAQSLNAEKLRMLDRDHAALDIVRAVKLARDRFRSVSLDLIFGAPGETLAVWLADVAAAIELRPDHVSTYGLTYERGTQLWSRWLKGAVVRANEEHERAMFAHAIDTLTAAGFEHYEVSNFAKPGQRCRHNEAYWACEGYFAVGPGAARYVDGRRELNHRSTTTYLKRVLAGQSPVAESECLGAEDRARELLVFGLRRIRGIERGEFARRTGFELDQLVGDEIEKHVRLRLLRREGDRVLLTREGLFLSDSIWPDFLRT